MGKADVHVRDTLRPKVAPVRVEEIMESSVVGPGSGIDTFLVASKQNFQNEAGQDLRVQSFNLEEGNFKYPLMPAIIAIRHSLP